MCETKFRTKWGVVCENWICGSRVMADKPFWAQLPQKWSLGSRPPIKPNFWNKLAAWCAKQNFEQNEGLFVKIYQTIPELQYFFIGISTKIWKNGVILVPFQFSKPTYKPSLISLKKPCFAGTKIWISHEPLVQIQKVSPF